MFVDWFLGLPSDFRYRFAFLQYFDKFIVL